MPRTNQDADRLPSLDGLRAIAIGLVLVMHCSHGTDFPPALKSVTENIPSGHYGVEVFFVISGFIITYLLMREERKFASISLRNFYIRRALRILPALGTYLACVVILEVVTPIHIRTVEWITILTFTRNMIHGEWLAAHLWSISVEEQFYFLWPFVVFVTRGALRARRAFALALIVTAPACRAFLIATGHAGHANVSFFTSMDFLMSGAALGMTVSEAKIQASILARRPTLVRLVAFALALGLWALQQPEHAPLVLRAVCPTLRALCIAILLASVVFVPHGVSVRILNWTPIARIGTISYGVYLWQQAFLVPSGYYGRNSAITSFPWNLIGALAVAALSYVVIEKPILQLKRRFESQRLPSEPVRA
jgi:peptidoglycan/LPS O-acetylase OafA/YrhL